MKGQRLKKQFLISDPTTQNTRDDVDPMPDCENVLTDL